jgi:hypothetical protein
MRETLDGRVNHWMLKEGFNVRLLPERKFARLGTWHLHIIPVGTYDSLFVLANDREFVLNLNDAKPSDRVLSRLSKQFGTCLAMFSQFSFAEWPGNPAEPSTVELTRDSYKARIIKALEIVRPKLFVPFASHVYFRHAENHWMNDFRINLDEMKRLARGRTQVAFLSPGSVLDLCHGQVSTEMNGDSMRWWDDHFAELRNTQPESAPECISVSAITELASSFFKTINAQNNKLLLTLLDVLVGRRQGVYVEITDLGCIMQVKARKPFIQVIPLSDVTGNALRMSSESLSRVFRTPHGPDEFMVAGRFQGAREVAEKLHGLLSISTLNRAGIHLTFRDLIQPKILKELWEAGLSYLAWRNKAPLLNPES